MSCNLRSSKYITDGQCVTTKPVVEAVCADRCLVYDSGALFSQRQRPSLMNIKQDHNVSGSEIAFVDMVEDRELYYFLSYCSILVINVI